MPERETPPAPDPLSNDPATHVIDESRSQVFTPIRRVVIGNRVFDGLEREIQVTHDGTLPSATVRLWNLTTETRRALSRGTTVEIGLGWVAGEQPTKTSARYEDGGNRVTRRVPRVPSQDARIMQTLIRGQIRARPSTRRAGVDIPTDITVSAEGGVRVAQHRALSWSLSSPPTIARSIGEWAGLNIGVIDPDCPVIDGDWAMTADRPVQDHLTRLAARAGRMTGDEWVWYVERGALSFRRRGTKTRAARQGRVSHSTLAERVRNVGAGGLGDEQRSDRDVDRVSSSRADPRVTTTTPFTLRYRSAPEGGSLTDVTPIDTPTGDGVTDTAELSPTLSITASVEPRFERGAIVELDTPAYSGRYEVTAYTYASSTRRGTHRTHATLVPLTRTYSR